MGKTYRFRTTPGEDKNIRLNIEQDFDFIEILSLKLKQEDVYTRFCADYGVVAGRVIVNGGYGVPNASVSIFVPLSNVDENDPVISTLYPYKTIETKNEDGYRYNLLPYRQEYAGHTPTGTFPDREDLLTRPEVLEVYEKYYKYTVRTNESGDFMIVGVPLGNQKIVLDLDLSNIGCFSLRPSDLIRMGMGVESEFAGSQFRSSTDINSLPQIINIVEDIEVASFWGEENICNVGITRLDFDLRDQGIEIKPHCVFMGSLVTTSDDDSLKANCKPKFDTGNLCDLTTGPGKILALRQTINSDSLGYPILEEYKLPQGGNVIDEDGTWLIEVPMNVDYVTTNEFGEQVISNDPNVGIPTKGKYRFKIQYQNEDSLENNFLRADYLIPNIKEYGWDTNINANGPSDTNLQLKSYAFSLDWNEYGDTGTTLGQQMIQEAINCDDRFFEFNFNRVYTVSSFIDRWKWGFNRARHLGIKEITNRTCNTTTNKFPVNDGVRNFDLIFFIVNLLLLITGVVIPQIILVIHFIALIYPIIRRIVNVIIQTINAIIGFICGLINTIRGWIGWSNINCPTEPINLLPERTFPRISLPMIIYPDCESCSCEPVTSGDGVDQYPDTNYLQQNINRSLLIDVNSIESFNWNENTEYIVFQSYCVGFPEGCEITERSFNFGINQGFAGYSGPQDKNKYKFNNVPIATWVDQQSRTGSQSYTVSYAQALNMLNAKARFIENSSVIYTTVKNTDFNGVEQVSDTILDQPLILVLDAGSLNQFGGPGSLITFTDIDDINDPNLTGATVNGFGTNAITGTANANTTTLIPKTINYLTTGLYGYNWALTQATLYLKLTESIKEYKFKGGVEYFQVITGGTLGEFSQYVGDPIWTSTIGQYIFGGGGMRFRWGKGYYRDSKWGKPINNTVKSLAITGSDVIAGGIFTTYGSSSQYSPKIVQINQDTGLKTFTYQGDGTNIGGFNGKVNKVIVLSNGNQIVGGSFTLYNNVAKNRLVKLSSSNGHPILAPGFGTGIDGGSSCEVLDIALQTWDDSIIVGGKSFTDYNTTPINRNLIRINSSGIIDGTFNVAGQFINDVTKIEIDNNTLSSNYQKIYVVVDSSNAAVSKKIIRLNNNGSTDTTFNFDLNTSTYSSTSVKTIKIDENGKLLVGVLSNGTATYGPSNAPINGIFRLNTDGSLDNTFNNGQVGFGNQNLVAVYSIELDQTNKIYVGGSFQGKTYSNATVGGVFKLLSDGTFDPTFNASQYFNGLASIVYDLKINNNVIFVGGSFSLSNPLLNSNLSAFYINDGSIKTNSLLITIDPVSRWRDVARGYNEQANWAYNGFNDKEIVFLTRGTDVYTEKQTIEYDLSKLFNKPLGTLKVKGQYYLNIPVQNSVEVPTVSRIDPQNYQPYVGTDPYFTPQSHDVINNASLNLFRETFCNFNPNNFTAFTNNSVKFYTSTDTTRKQHKAFDDDSLDLGYFTQGNQGKYCQVNYYNLSEHSTVGFSFTTNPLESDDPGFSNFVASYNNNVTYDQGHIQGCSFIGSTITPGEVFDLENSNNFARIYAPSYHLENENIDVVMETAYRKRLVLRSDRLPTSSVPKVNGNTSLPLFMNDNFLILSVNERGQAQTLNVTVNQTIENTGNSADIADDENPLSDVILNSLSCEGLTALRCYTGYGENFGVESPCAINEDGDLTKQRVIGGCYYFVQPPYLDRDNMDKDILFYREWQNRFLLNFAACRGVISHVFQNNWINGVLYSFSFNKKTFFDIQGNVNKYKYCGTDTSTIRPNQGPLYFNDPTNNFYYRCTPYNGTPSNGKFIGQQPRQISDFGLGSWGPANYDGMNDRNIFFPTTLMDLGPRDEFAKEVCLNPQLDGYLMDTIKSTSFNDTSDILLFFILSRILNSNFNNNASSVSTLNALFSRSENRIDGDVAQMFSINSEYGILPFNDDNYDDNDIFLLDNNGPLIGFYLTGNTENRISLSPNLLIFGNTIQQIGYPKTQRVPMYKWQVGNTNNIFGNEQNTWFTNLENGEFYSIPYQEMSFNNTEYFKPDNGNGPFNGTTGYIINYDSNGQPNQDTTVWPNNQQSNKFVVGAPYHFYFGLRKGKTSINKYITKYILPV